MEQNDKLLPMYVFSLTTENTLRVLQRVSTIFSRQRLNIEQLNVSETRKKGVSHFIIVVHAKEDVKDRVYKQLKRIIEVLNVHVNAQDIESDETETTASYLLQFN